MEHLNIAICDDEISVLGIVSGSIVSAFARHKIQATVDTFGRVKELDAKMKEKNYDLLFLDIDMPQMDGITYSRRLRASNIHTDVIFISSREDKVFDALRTNPSGFIRKSKFLEDVAAVVDNWVKTRPAEKSPALVVKSEDGTVNVKLENILYIEGSGKNQELHLTDSKTPLVLHRSMQELEEALDSQGFLRIHKGYLVNYKFIRRLNDTDALLTNGESIPLSRRRVQEIRAKYLELMQGGGSILL